MFNPNQIKQALDAAVQEAAAGTRFVPGPELEIVTQAVAKVMAEQLTLVMQVVARATQPREVNDR